MLFEPDFRISLLVQSALDGYRVAILAYGQTGSGKTHTMLGPDTSDPGVIPRTVELIFQEVEQLRGNGWESGPKTFCFGHLYTNDYHEYHMW